MPKVHKHNHWLLDQVNHNNRNIATHNDRCDYITY